MADDLRISGPNRGEVLFLVEKDSAGCYIVRASGYSIFTEADDLEKLNDMIRDAVRCHFDDDEDELRIVVRRVDK